MQNILYLSYLGGLGGGESILLTHLIALDRARFSPHVICATRGAFVDELNARQIPNTVIPFRLPYFKGGILPVLSPSFFPRLYNYVRAQRIQLIHCNDLETAYYAGPLAKLVRVPLVWTIGGWWQVESGWKSRFMEKMFTRIVSPTSHMRACLLRANARLEPRITLIPFGVDVQEFTPGARDPKLLEEWGITPDAPLVTLLARFQSVKGHATFLDAAPTILDAFPRARFLFVGDTAFETRDANATREAIHARVKKDARLRAAIVFAGFRRDIPRLLRATDVLVCPSNFESYGMANLEAMACGVPVVSTNVGGPSETVTEGETGFLVPPRAPAQLAARVSTLLGDQELRLRMGTHARQRVEKCFSLRTSVEQLQNLYQEL